MILLDSRMCVLLMFVTSQIKGEERLYLTLGNGINLSLICYDANTASTIFYVLKKERGEKNEMQI